MPQILSQSAHGKYIEVCVGTQGSESEHALGVTNSHSCTNPYTLHTALLWSLTAQYRTAYPRLPPSLTQRLQRVDDSWVLELTLGETRFPQPWWVGLLCTVNHRFNRFLIGQFTASG